MALLTEESALLGVEDVASIQLPLLHNYLSRLVSLTLEEKDQIPNILRPDQLTSNRALLASFSLLVLLLFREKKLREQSPRNSPWDTWKHEISTEVEWIQVIDANIEQVWTSFLASFCSTRDIETVLWTEFRIDEKGKPLPVVDFVRSHPILLNHRVIELSMKIRWKQGPFVDHSRSQKYLTSRYDALCTPWLYHFFDLASQLAFLFLLVSYVLKPPRPALYSQPLEYVGSREIMIMILSVSAILHSWTTSLPFVLTLLAFLLKLPSVPFPQEFHFRPPSPESQSAHYPVTRRLRSHSTSTFPAREMSPSCHAHYS
ncbi:hypothetical protein BDP27DRAFT_1448668 [Rhodocollybia butyracea]|uniref:Uncharacterized protein n=1 Tax=Rhodocollybia butyracea TaxID=206335 RepID=A0A9P5PRU1_9AGAR|nr:hypothetical protein BDP27DRAFT_1448668 [Rhodocollybia butyracea]